MGLFSNGPWNKLLARGNRPALIGLTFTTDGSGVPTIVSTNGADSLGRVSVAQGTGNNFVVTVGAFKTCYYAFAGSDKVATINIKTVPSASAGTFELQCSAALQSAQVSVLLLIAS
jgi:hypothetical protein